METSFVIGNMAWNAGLVGVVGILFKRWMDKIEKQIEDNRQERIESVEKYREGVKEEQVNLSRQLEGIYLELHTANGRTAKIEGRLETQIAVCEERNR